VTADDPWFEEEEESSDDEYAELSVDQMLARAVPSNHVYDESGES
jgi:hypothetical protein